MFQNLILFLSDHLTALSFLTFNPVTVVDYWIYTIEIQRETWDIIDCTKK